jgi:putative Holliday junction resolvase
MFNMPEGKAMALDIGTRKTGVAISDAGRRVVFLRDVISHTNEPEHLKKIAELLEKEQPTTLVLGLSLNQGEETKQSEFTRSLAAKIQECYFGEIAWVDESFSSLEAEEHVQGEDSHSQAARIILDSFLHQSGQSR